MKRTYDPDESFFAGLRRSLRIIFVFWLAALGVFVYDLIKGETENALVCLESFGIISAMIFLLYGVPAIVKVIVKKRKKNENIGSDGEDDGE